MDDLIKAIDKITEEEIIKLVISNKLNKDTEYKKIVFQLKEKNKKDFYQIEKYTEKQVFHENIEKKELKEKVEELFISINLFICLYLSYLEFITFPSLVKTPKSIRGSIIIPSSNM